MSSNPYGLEEGSIESNAEYHPERMVHSGSNYDTSYGEPEQVWEEYGLEIVPVPHDGEDVGSRRILRNGEYIADCSDQYKLLPNEEAVYAADEIADQLGAVPFSEFGGDWFIRLNEHVFQDEEAKRAHALYAWDDPVDVTGTGDEVQMGFAVHNSIDTSMGFKVGLFTFRHACANMVFMGVDRVGQGWDARNVIEHYDRKHTKGLDIDNLRVLIEDTVGYGHYVIEAYKAWTEMDLDCDLAMALIRQAQSSALAKGKDIPAWLQDAVEAVDTIEQRARENHSLTPEQKGAAIEQTVERHIPHGETVWDTYNDVTEYIWHADNSDDTKMRKMDALHRAIPIPAGDEPVVIG